MEPAETPPTPADGLNSGEELETAESCNRDCCNKKQENMDTGCSKPTACCCCRTVIMINCGTKKSEDRVSSDANCLQRPRKCLDVCKQGCCVTILCDGVRRKICLTIICAKNDGKTCCRASENVCRKTEGVKGCCKASSSSTTCNANTASGQCVDCKKCGVDSTGCVKKTTCCSKSGRISDGKCSRTEEEVENLCHNDSKNSEGVNCCSKKASPDVSTDAISSSKVTQEGDEKSFCSDLKNSCYQDQSKNSCSSKFCTSLCQKSDGTIKKTCCSKSSCSCDDGCSKATKVVGKSSCCGGKNCNSSDVSTDENKIGVTKKGNEQLCCNGSKDRCCNVQVENCCSKCKCCTSFGCCETKWDDSKSYCEGLNLNCCGLEIGIDVVEKRNGFCQSTLQNCCKIKMNCPSNCIGDCCHSQLSKIECDDIKQCCTKQECCKDEEDGKMKQCNTNCPEEFCQCSKISECCSNQCCKGKNCCNGALGQKAGCCEIKIACDDKTCSDTTNATKDLQKTEKHCCSKTGDALDGQNKCSEECNCAQKKDQDDCCGGECTPVVSSIKSNCCSHCDVRRHRTSCSVAKTEADTRENQCCCCKTSKCVGGPCLTLKVRKCLSLKLKCCTATIQNRRDSVKNVKKCCCQHSGSIETAPKIQKNCCCSGAGCDDTCGCKGKVKSPGTEKHCCSECSDSLGCQNKCNEECSCAQGKNKDDSSAETTAVDSPIKANCCGNCDGKCCNCSCFCIIKPSNTKGCCSLSLKLKCCTVTIQNQCDCCNVKKCCCQNSGLVETASNIQKNSCCSRTDCCDGCGDTCGCKGNVKSTGNEKHCCNEYSDSLDCQNKCNEECSCAQGKNKDDSSAETTAVGSPIKANCCGNCDGKCCNCSCFCIIKPSNTKGCCSLSLKLKCCTVTIQNQCDCCNVKKCCCQNSGLVETASNIQKNSCCSGTDCCDGCGDTCGCKGKVKSTETEKHCCNEYSDSLDCQNKCNEECSCAQGKNKDDSSAETTAVGSPIKANCCGNCDGKCCNCSCFCIIKPSNTKGCCSLSLKLKCCTVTIQNQCDCCNVKKCCCQNSGLVETASNIQKNSCCSGTDCCDGCGDTCGCKGKVKSTETEKHCCSEYSVSLDCQNECNEGCSCAQEKHNDNSSAETTAVDSPIKANCCGNCDGKCCNCSCFCLIKPLDTNCCCSISLKLKCCTVTIQNRSDCCNVKKCICQNSGSIETASKEKKNCGCSGADCCDGCDDICGCQLKEKSISCDPSTTSG
ncbi:hypothetical protein GE061_020107 [Apolygus lucorum]|uniref:Uncharacterized protein n=1 Tax=Apolygus lucorum TaxID=248454 RepID=A0A6A4JHZ6_APOLU|nr:hypothetical protein GE061_020107 [Apolygus lucorum]